MELCASPLDERPRKYPRGASEAPYRASPSKVRLSRVL